MFSLLPKLLFTSNIASLMNLRRKPNHDTNRIFQTYLKCKNLENHHLQRLIDQRIRPMQYITKKCGIVEFRRYEDGWSILNRMISLALCLVIILKAWPLLLKASGFLRMDFLWKEWRWTIGNDGGDGSLENTEKRES